MSVLVCISVAEDYLLSYKFIAAFENSDCNDYVTEKLWRAYRMGVVPGVGGLVRVSTCLQWWGMV